MTINLLIVDDELEICKTLQRFLELDSVYNVEIETSPEAALEKVKREVFHIVLSDIMMPSMDGIELLREIKKVDGLVQVVMMTAFSTVDKVITCLEVGASDYIMKPFEDLEDVKKVLDQIVEKLTRWRTVVVASQKLAVKE